MIRRTSTHIGPDTLHLDADDVDFKPAAQLLDHEGRRYFIAPAGEMMLGSARTSAGGTVRLLIQLGDFGTGLVSALSHQELRALGESMVAAADELEAGAASALKAAIDKAAGK